MIKIWKFSLNCACNFSIASEIWKNVQNSRVVWLREAAYDYSFTTRVRKLRTRDRKFGLQFKLRINDKLACSRPITVKWSSQSYKYKGEVYMSVFVIWSVLVVQIEWKLNSMSDFD